MKTTYAGSVQVEPKPCPFCKSSKVMVEGDGKNVYAVCQKCLAHGPEIFVAEMTMEEFRNAAMHAWNDRNKGKFSKVKCPDCSRLVSVTARGLWTHTRRGQVCPGSFKPLSEVK